MFEEIERERKIAEHLFYVSLKYTKTGDVILNLIERWEKMLDKCIDQMLRKAKKKKKIKAIPIAPKARELLVRTIYKDKLVVEVMNLYALFRKIPTLEKIRESEFRKHVAIKINDASKEIVINMTKLEEWNALLENFINFVKNKI